MPVSENTDTRLMWPTPERRVGKHRLNEDLQTELISAERRAAVLRPEFPTFEPAVVPVPDPEPAVRPKPLATALDRIRRNVPALKRWARR